MKESINPFFPVGIVSFLWKPYTQSMRNQEQHHDAPWPLPKDASCFLMCFCFSNTPGWLWPPSCHLLFAIKENFGCHLVLSTAAPQWPMSPVTPNLCSHSLYGTEVHHAHCEAGLAARRHVGILSSQGPFSCYFKPCVYNQSMFLPQMYSRTAARLLAFTQVSQVPPVLQVCSSLPTQSVGSGTL